MLPDVCPPAQHHHCNSEGDTTASVGGRMLGGMGGGWSSFNASPRSHMTLKLPIAPPLPLATPPPPPPPPPRPSLLLPAQYVKGSCMCGAAGSGSRLHSRHGCWGAAVWGDCREPGGSAEWQCLRLWGRHHPLQGPGWVPQQASRRGTAHWRQLDRNDQGVHTASSGQSGLLHVHVHTMHVNMLHCKCRYVEGT